MATEVELKRGKELFDALIKNQGLEAALLPFLDKYNEEDKQEYNFSILLKYLQAYTQSEYISKEEATKYNKLRSISKSTLLKRGKELCDTQIANKFRVASLEPLGTKYAQEDKRYLPYSKPLLDRMINAYLKTASPGYIEKYHEIMELSKRSTTDGLDFDTLKTIANHKNATDALVYLHEHYISYDSLKALRNAYFQVHPEDLLTRAAIDSLEDLIHFERNAEGIEKSKSGRVENNQKRHQDKIDKLKAIMSDYINSGKDNLEECVKKGGYSTTKSFMDALNAEKEGKDEELKDLYQSYLSTEASFAKERRKLAETLADYYENGVYYGHENRQFSLYDYYVLTDKNSKEVSKILRTYLPIGQANHIIAFIGNLTITNKFPNRESFLEQLKKLYPTLDKKERDYIIDYMEDNNWPYSITLFKDIWVRLADGLITIPEKSQKSANNLYKP